MVEVKAVSDKDNRLYKWLYFALRAGIACSLCLVILGFILFGITKAGFAKSIITLGILILVLIPLSSIVLAMVNFLMEKDKLYIGISIAIVCILVLSLALALV